MDNAGIAAEQQREDSQPRNTTIYLQQLYLLAFPDLFPPKKDLAHQGPIRLIMERFDWNDLQKAIREWTRWYIPCQTTKVHRHNKAPIGFFDAPTHATTTRVLSCL